jgi:hypothetical protein
MRWTNSALIVCLLGAGCSGDASDHAEAAPRHHFEASFGESRYLLPPHNPPKEAADFVANGKSIIPPTILKCGGVEPRYEQWTDGGAKIIFHSQRSLPEMTACLTKAFPNIRVDYALTTTNPVDGS